MTKVKSALEKAMEKIKDIEFTESEKREMKDKEIIKTALADFFKFELDTNGLQQRLKEISPQALNEAQIHIAETFRLNSTNEEMQLRKDGILAIEALKEKKNITAIKNVISAIERIQKEYTDLKHEASEELKAEIERNPHMRMRPVQTPDGRVVMQATISVDEAFRTHLAEFLADHEKRYEMELSALVNKLKNTLK